VPGRSPTHAGLAARLAQIAGWRTATRDDAAVASELHQTRALDRIHGINEAAFFDELFCHIREIGAWPLLEALDPDHRSGPLHPFLQRVLFTIMRCVGGVQSMLATYDVLLTDERLMGLLGFNAVQVQAGANERGLSRRKKPVDVRGPFSFETVADNIVRIGLDRLVALFNGVIRRLAGPGPSRVERPRRWRRRGEILMAACTENGIRWSLVAPGRTRSEKRGPRPWWESGICLAIGGTRRGPHRSRTRRTFNRSFSTPRWCCALDGAPKDAEKEVVLLMRGEGLPALA